jgi:hypothetical protein
MDFRLWAAHILIGAVIAWNLQCALVFFLHPETFSPGFELTGAYAALSASILRFIAFDAAGVILLVVALFLAKSKNSKTALRSTQGL